MSRLPEEGPGRIKESCIAMCEHCNKEWGYMETRVIYETVGDPLTGGLTDMKVGVASCTQFVPVKPKFCPECGKRIKRCDSTR